MSKNQSYVEDKVPSDDDFKTDNDMEPTNLKKVSSKSKEKPNVLSSSDSSEEAKI